MGPPHASPGARQLAERRSRRLGGRLLAIVILAGMVFAPAGWVVSDRLEQDNDFCNACHLSDEAPLHVDVRNDFDSAAPVSLASVHGASDPGRRGDGSFRCIDCHGGVSFVGRARVKALAAKDAFWYLAGHFEEPQGMGWPLWDEDCSQCHADFDERDSESWRQPRFHQLPVHNVELGVNCVECHRVHETGGPREAYFLKPPLVRTQCARCHSKFEEG
jgi:nitrate/TMAO reductase-like tetraheme cytochrome c subunit